MGISHKRKTNNNIITTMNIKDLNRFSIKDYLAEMNFYPVKDRGYYGMYHSPFREDKDASLKVDYNKNLWIDFGSNEGGTFIDLVMRINICDAKEAISILQSKYADMQLHNQSDDTSFSFHGQPSIILQEVKTITNPALIDYLKERAINIDIAKLHCKELHYTVNDKAYFAIGFLNDSGGYELRNKYFKGCTSKDYTSQDIKSDSCLIFEGFMDYLSYMTLKSIKSVSQDVVVLNSVANLLKAMNFIQSHKNIYTYLDNDEAGKKATLLIQQSHPHVVDQSVKYTNYKDLNEYLTSTKRAQENKNRQEVKRKPSRGFKM